MQTIETTASFDEKGEIKIDNLPNLKNQKVKLLILFEENEHKEWFNFSAKRLIASYGDNEPIYTLDLIKEPNSDFDQ